MAQFQGFNANVANASTTVRATWVCFTATPSGTFTAGEGVTWGVDGVGVLILFDALTQSARLTRTSGAEPAEGDTITGDTSTETADITYLQEPDLPTNAGSPPRFGDSPDQGAILEGHVFAPLSSLLTAQVGATVDRDTFELAVAWGGATLSDSQAVVGRDSTPTVALATVGQGEAMAANLFSQNFTELDRLLYYRRRNKVGSNYPTNEVDFYPEVGGERWGQGWSGAMPLYWGIRNGMLWIAGGAKRDTSPPVLSTAQEIIFTLPVYATPDRSHVALVWSALWTGPTAGNPLIGEVTVGVGSGTYGGEVRLSAWGANSGAVDIEINIVVPLIRNENI